MWLASSSASSTSMILIYCSTSTSTYTSTSTSSMKLHYSFRICLQYGCWFGGEANSVYTDYIVSSASNGKIQAGVFVFVLLGYIVSSSSKPYQPPQARNKHVNVIFTQSGKTYNPPVNPNDQPNDSETPINFDSDNEDEEPTPQPNLKELKPIKETLILKPYKPKIPYPQCLEKEKMEAQYGKFLDMIRAV
ncbi:hypothetical protein Tco_0199134 [Tanacetum coccineum]